jgi:hypothetical protein
MTTPTNLARRAARRLNAKTARIQGRISRRLAFRRASGLPSPNDRSEWLTPVLVDYFGRDGSTLLMRLLASSPQIAVEPHDTHELRSYELRYFAYLWGWAALLDAKHWPEKTWNDRALNAMLRREPPALVGPPPWRPRALLEQVPAEESMSRRCFDLAWREFSRRAARLTRIEHGRPNGEVLFYAEKHLNAWQLDRARLPPLRILAVLRDPRDTFASMGAFDRRWGSAGFGRERTSSEAEYVASFIRRQRLRLRWIADLIDSDDESGDVVRYTELVRDLDGVASGLEDRLGVSLDPAAVMADRRMLRIHVTAPSPEDSIGRWRRELTPALAKRLGEELRSELQSVGFDTE